MKKRVIVAAVLMIAQMTLAADQTEKGVSTSPLKIYSGGIAVGAVRGFNSELKHDVGKNLLKLSFSNVFAIKSNVALFLDATMLLPEQSYGGDFGADFIFSESEFRPFAGIGVGGYLIDHGGDFSDDFGPSLTAHIGFTLDITENVAVRIRAPFHIVLNEYDDQMAGVDLTFLFSSKYKNVKKLNYN